MKVKILTTAILTLLAISALLIMLPSTSAATTTFGQSTKSGSTNTSLNTALGARYTNTIPGQANSISAYLSYSPSTGTLGEENGFFKIKSGYANLEDQIRGQTITTPSAPILVTSIKARIAAGMTHEVKAAIYTAAGQFVVGSNPQSVPGITFEDRSFTLTSPTVLNPSSTYLLVIWANSDNGDVGVAYNEDQSGRVLDATYGSWPATANLGTLPERNYYIWCEYQTAAKVQCAIYSADGTTRLGTTEQKTLTSATSGWTTFNFNTKPTLNANTQYVLAAWSNNPAVNLYYTGTTAQGFAGSGSSVPSTLSVSGTRNYNLYASTAYQKITASAGTDGSISPSGATNVAYGSSQSFSITPKPGYHIIGVTIDGTTLAETVTSYNFPSVTSDHTIAAAFAINTYKLTVMQTAHGTISPATTTVNYDSNQTFSITPETGYHIVDVKVDGSSVEAVTQYTFSHVNAAHTITATYAINTYTLTVTQGSHGTISPGTTTVNNGESKTFGITAETGYHIVDVLVDGHSVGVVTAHDFTNVVASHTITANYAINTYAITVTQTAHGTIAPGTTTVNYGDNPTFSITADPQYHITDVIVDGASVGPVATYQFTNVNAAHTITANYAITQVATALTVACTPDTVDKSGSMITTVSGTLTTSGGAPIAGQPVALTYNDGTQQPITTATTQADGSYSYTWTAPSSLPNGHYVITATYTGDNNPYQSSTAQTTVGGGGLFVVPEYAFGALGAVFSLFAAFGLVQVRHKRNLQQ